MSSVYEAVAAITAEIGAIAKGSTSGRGGDQWSYSYRGIDDVMNALHPLLAKHQVTIVPRCVDTDHVELQRSERLTIARYEYDVYGPDGSMFTGAVTAEGVGQRDKSAVIASSYAWRTFVTLLFCIPTEDLSDPEEDNTPVERQVTLTDEHLTELVGLFNDLPEGPPRNLAKQAFQANWGSPNKIPVEEWAAARRAAAELIQARLDSNAEGPPDSPLPEPNGGDTEARRYLRAEVDAYAPLGMDRDQYMDALLVKANVMRPDANKGEGFESWRDLQKHPALITELLRQTQAGTLENLNEEPFE